jgi:hypothetical protein
MAKAPFITAALAAGVLSGCAHAPLEGAAVLPPEPYRTAAAQGVEAGEYVIREMMGFRMDRACLGQSQHACAVSVCIIYLRSDLEARWDYPFIILHEAGHCEGWPADHPGVVP